MQWTKQPYEVGTSFYMHLIEKDAEAQRGA